MCAAAVTFFLLTTPIQGGERQCVLADAYKFGVGFQRVRRFYLIASAQPGVMRETVAANNTSDVVAEWEAECTWRRRCWDLLDDAIYMENFTVYRRVESLQRLRELIGDEAYFAGRMPNPTPTDRVPEFGLCKGQR